MNWIWALLWWLLLVAVIAVVGNWFWTDYSFQILTIIVFLNAAATIELLQRVTRRPEKNFKKKFLNRLWRSKPITPKHQPPAPLDPDAWGVDKAELEFFSDFEDFANVVNWWLADPDLYHDNPWRLQELPKSQLLHLSLVDSPTYGRCYAVFHNEERLGKIEVKPLWDYSTENPHVRLYVELDFVRLLPAGRIRSFLSDIALHISEYHPGTIEYVQINQQIDLALTAVLWKTQEISEFGFEKEPGPGDIEMQLEGVASFYLQRRQAFRNQAAKAQQQT